LLEAADGNAARAIELARQTKSGQR